METAIGIEAVLDRLRAATSEADLDRAAALLADAIALIGVTRFAAAVFRGAERVSGGTKTAKIRTNAYEPPHPLERRVAERRSSSASAAAAKPLGTDDPGNTAVSPSVPPSQGLKAHPPAGSLPRNVPKTLADAPTEIQLPDVVDQAMKKSFGASFPEGRSQERSGTIVLDKDGTISVANEKTDKNSSSVSPNRTISSGQSIIGTYHTHPYDEQEGGHRGVSFSDADILYAINYKEQMYVEAGSKQFMIMPTQETPTPDRASFTQAWKAVLGDQLANGASLPDASRVAAKAMAIRYKMAYYESDDGKLKRVGH